MEGCVRRVDVVIVPVHLLHAGCNDNSRTDQEQQPHGSDGQIKQEKNPASKHAAQEPGDASKRRKQYETNSPQEVCRRFLVRIHAGHSTIRSVRKPPSGSLRPRVVPAPD
jgi:hypothetical protein